MEEDEPLALRPSLLTTVKLHHVLNHAPNDILGHGHEKYYSAQVSQATFWAAKVIEYVALFSSVENVACRLTSISTGQF